MEFRDVVALAVIVIGLLWFKDSLQEDTEVSAWLEERDKSHLASTLYKEGDNWNMITGIFSSLVSLRCHSYVCRYLYAARISSNKFSANEYVRPTREERNQ